MSNGLHQRRRGWHRCSAFVLSMSIAVLVSSTLNSQTTSTGAATGVTLDPSGSVVAGVVVRIANQDTGVTASATSDNEGRFCFLLLRPGRYEVQASKTGAVPLVGSATINVNVTETLHLELHLQLATVVRSIKVSANTPVVQTETSSLGRVVNEATLSGLPLVTRNFAQIASLSPGVITGVYNAGGLGSGGTALSQIASSNDGLFVHGARSYDNNFQLDGISVSDVQGSAAGSGGIPIPNPDSIQEFKVQTGLYDAAYGRYGGANVSLVTKTGSNTFHGTIFEFFRNAVLNANDFFLSRAGQARPVLNQNQFGFSFGGPVMKDKLQFFSSYQGTRQVNGIAAGQSRTACSASLTGPPLINDRTAAALGALFGGRAGANGGVAINSDGSNINPVALALLNLKLSDGTFLIPTPQVLDPTKTRVDDQGLSVFSEPCHFNEDQISANLDYVAGPKGRLSGRFFLADDDQTVTFPGNGVNAAGNIPGFLSPGETGFRVFSLAHAYTFNSAWINEARVGYLRTRSSTEATTPFSWSDIGVAEGEMSRNNELPSLKILGSTSIASGF